MYNPKKQNDININFSNNVVRRPTSNVLTSSGWIPAILKNSNESWLCVLKNDLSDVSQLRFYLEFSFEYWHDFQSEANYTFIISYLISMMKIYFIIDH